MKTLFIGAGVLVLGIAVTLGLGRATASASSSSGGVTVAIASSRLGPVLVDRRGRTLYLFARDAHGRSACAGTCAASWPPLLASGKTLATRGARSKLLGTIRRRDGRLQVTYNHHALYTFVGDTRKGQVNGEEVDAFGAEWYAVSASGTRVEANAATSGTTTQPGDGYGSGY
jgi:predicted lipoprotein with Yx(FWY)xxD motif